MTRQVLITGAAGLVGKRVVSDLAAADYNVTAVIRDAEQRSRLKSPADPRGIVWIACDLADAAEVSRLAGRMGAVDVLVHLAGGPPANSTDHGACTSQVLASTNLICAFGSRIDHAIIGSCTSVYGHSAQASVPEDHPPTYPTTYHGSGQLAGEQLWHLFSIHTGKPVACLRFDLNALQAARSADGFETLRPGGIVEEASRAVLSTLSNRKNGILNVYPKRA
jgi:UDP-glucose 4-epimerase